MQKQKEMHTRSNITTSTPADSSISQQKPRNPNPLYHHHRSSESLDFASFYPSMFPPFSSNSPSDCSFDDDAASSITTTAADNNNHRLSQARLVLEYQQLYNRYAMCLAHLQDSLKEIDLLREANETIQIANGDLVKRLTLLSQATIQNCLVTSGQHHPPLDFGRLSIGAAASNVEQSHNHRIGGQRGGGKERVVLPKSISVRSSGYQKVPPQRGGGAPSRSGRINSVKSPSQLSESQRVYVPGGKKEEEALEFEVFNQGMFKTELCNKWQETGACPYGDNCQFAHGISELRPVIRHPRYKTEVCRMVLAGDNCPYGHRCHFRHSLTEEEKLLGPLRLNGLDE